MSEITFFLTVYSKEKKKYEEIRETMEYVESGE
jgi:hypothetical protein